MERERWQRLQEVFAVARSLSDDERERVLEERRRDDPALADEVRALLAADAATGVMDALSPHLASVSAVLDVPAPVRVGPYRIVSEIGRGGMGTVYLADRAEGDFSQRVAVKLIDTSDADDPLHQRFIAERRILAGLVHPHIARLLDGGVTDDGRPYLVMEYVDGLPITRYCDDRQLDIPARLRLFADVCAAVQHAHQSLVIHRDLKPSNILVSADGRVHLLDFGIAKLIDPMAGEAPQTRIESRMMTPEHASPEQVRGETLGTTSDIYSLGVLLYELLCGCGPYRVRTRSPIAIATAVCEQDPERPSARAVRADAGDGPDDREAAARVRGTSADRLARTLDGDLDGIVLMAIRKEPARRYASADMLRQDVERYLTGLPVLAHRGSRRYRVGKFVRRHRVETAAAAVVIAALVGGLSVAVQQERRAARERDRAERALAESSAVTEFLLELFRSGEPGDVPAADLTASDLLQRGAFRADDLSNQPVVHARLLDVIGQMSFHLGRLDEAQARLENATAIHRAAGSEAGDLASTLVHLAWVHRTRNEYDRARTLVTEALELRRGALPPGHPDIGDALYELGWLSFGATQEHLYRQALEILSADSAAAERRLTILQALATNLRRQGRLTDAVAAAREARTVAEASFGPEHHTTAAAMIHLADHVADIEADHTTAERLYRRALELTSRKFGASSVRLLHGMNSLGRLLSSRADVEAETILRRALAISRAATGPDHPRVADQMHKLAGALARLKRLPEAETLARDALALTIKTVGPSHQIIAASRMPLIAEILDLQRRHAEADQMYKAALDRLHTSSVINGEIRREYGRILLRRGDARGAEEQLLQSLTSLQQAYQSQAGPTHPNIQETQRALMTLYGQMGRPDLVERYRVPPGRFIPY
jgi:eukaryotic-like serine/threonine-protein kinase